MQHGAQQRQTLPHTRRQSFVSRDANGSSPSRAISPPYARDPTPYRSAYSRRFCRDAEILIEREPLRHVADGGPDASPFRPHIDAANQ